MNGRRLADSSSRRLRSSRAGCGGSDSNEASPDTTAVPTETMSVETTSTTDSGTSTDDGSIGDLSGDCAQFAGVSSKIAQSLSGQDANMEDAAKAFADIADQVPDEIKDDYQVIAENFSKIAEALKGVDLTNGADTEPGSARQAAGALEVDGFGRGAAGDAEHRGLGQPALLAGCGSR